MADLSNGLAWLVTSASLLLLTVSAFVSGSEIAFFSLDPSQRNTLDEAEDDQSKIVLTLLSTPDEAKGPRRLLATILVLNNAVNILIILLSTVLMQHWLPALHPTLAVVLQVFGVTFLIVLFGEVLPKVYANRNPLALARRMARPLQLAQQLLRPIWQPMNALAGALSRSVESAPHELSVSDLEHAVNITDSDDRTDEENRILSGIVNFGSKDVKQIMTPRTAVTALSHDLAWGDLKAKLAEGGFSRVPIYEDGLDQVKGILYVKDILPQRHQTDFEWNALLRQPFFVPENRMIDDLLRDFQSMKVHLAIVVDEYGGTSGIVTLEDVIEEIVGDISDEFDDEDILYSRINERTVVFQGKTALIDAYRILGIDGTEFESEKGESDTLGGFVVEQLARLPKPGEKLTFQGIEIVAEAVDRRRVLQVKVMLPDADTPREEKGADRRGPSMRGGVAIVLAALMSLTFSACDQNQAVPRPKGYFRIALHDTLFSTVTLDCPLDIEMAKSAQLEPVRNFAPDSCWFNIVYPEYKARVHCTYASGVQLDPVLKDAFSLAYEHEVKADAIEIERMDFEDGGMNLTWHIQGNAASPLQFLSTDGNDQFLRGALYFELRPNADSLNPVITRLSADVNHLVAHLDWR
ncbi:MAG: gliding motility-associated protein GldE [Flavobacteriales bacterium]|nr:gliding motility-associated protein GldE [Flavobacteriales bacterium]